MGARGYSGTVPLSGQFNTASPGYVVVEHADLLRGTSAGHDRHPELIRALRLS